MTITRKDRQEAPEDLRLHRRYHTRLTSRLVAAGADVSCTVIDLSAGGAKLKTDVSVNKGETVALSIPGIGFMRGAVCRLEEDMICVAFEITHGKTSNLTTRIAKHFTATSAPDSQDSKS